MTQLRYDFGFDRFHKDYDKIFRLESVHSHGATVWAINSRPFAERFFESSPHIVAGALTYSRGGELFFHVEKDGVLQYYKENAINVTPEFTDVFTFNFVEGNRDALKMPGNVLIPLSLSRKLFGNESAIGKHLIIEWGNMTVGAVYQDFPSNSILDNNIFIAIPEDENKNDWEKWNYHVYLRVNDASNTPLIIENFKRYFDAQAVWGIDFSWEESGENVRLTSLPDIHFTTGVLWDNTPKANRQVL
jgi:putative ABC transport system permease protein